MSMFMGMHRSYYWWYIACVAGITNADRIIRVGELHLVVGWASAGSERRQRPKFCY
jgi:hypothetical protein